MSFALRNFRRYVGVAVLVVSKKVARGLKSPTGAWQSDLYILSSKPALFRFPSVPYFAR